MVDDVPGEEVDADGGLGGRKGTWLWRSISPLTKRSMIELLPTPLSPSRTTLYLSCERLLLLSSEGFISILYSAYY